MYGVILWSDPDIGQAVIWCEDRGDLVFYQAPSRSLRAGGGFLDTGDYVEFDDTGETGPRRAYSARTVLPAPRQRRVDALPAGDSVQHRRESAERAAAFDLAARPPDRPANSPSALPGACITRRG